jgi:hypothetical protein
MTHKELTPDLLILPAAIVLLAAALFIVRWKE